VSAGATLEVAGDMVALSVALRLPAPLPLANSGLGGFGFDGLFAPHGRRGLAAVRSSDPIERELEWDLDRPFAHRDGQFALGLGVVVGPLPDLGFPFNARGGLVVELPDPSVTVSLEAHFLTPPPAVDDRPSGPPSFALDVLGLLSVNADGLA